MNAIVPVRSVAAAWLAAALVVRVTSVQAPYETANESSDMFRLHRV